MLVALWGEGAPQPGGVGQLPPSLTGSRGQSSCAWVLSL